MVLGAAVVPECDRIRLPLETHAQLGGLHVAVEHFEYRVAFSRAQTDDVGSEKAIHEQAFPPSLGMGPDNRMLGARIGLAAIVVAVASAVVLLAIVNRSEAADQLADRLGEHLKGEIHVGEHSIAAA